MFRHIAYWLVGKHQASASQFSSDSDTNAEREGDGLVVMVEAIDAEGVLAEPHGVSSSGMRPIDTPPRLAEMIAARTGKTTAEVARAMAAAKTAPESAACSSWLTHWLQAAADPAARGAACATAGHRVGVVDRVHPCRGLW